MTNKQIAKLFKLMASIMELYDENPFKIKAYSGAVYAIEKLGKELVEMSDAELEMVDGLGKSIISKILEIKQKGTFDELEKLAAQTPLGVVNMLKIKGIGPKKVKTIWKETGIDTIEALRDACEEGKIAQLKGFGEKTQQTILENIVFLISQEGWFYYAEAEPVALELETEIKTLGFPFSLSGDVRRKMETAEEIRFVIATENTKLLFSQLDQFKNLEKTPKACSPFAWRGKALPLGIKVEIKVCEPEAFGSKLILDSAGAGHLEKQLENGLTLSSYFRKNKFKTEEDAYASLNYPVFLPELREGLVEFNVQSSKFKEGGGDAQPTTHNPQLHLIEFKDLKGALHNHTTYSDGEHTLLQMAQKCIEMGWEYFGVADHSKSAQYANGLFEEKVLQQHKEIDELNKQLAPFKILKGTESDILSDGSLDYDDSMLKTFDYVVASVHSGLKMSEEKATARLIKAVENPYTTILGHPTSRLLLKRPGYPINHQKVIDACVANGVCIELNANPYRLDLDWRWLPYALEKGAMVAINPDAHEMDGLLDMYYGVSVARKGLLSANNCLNALSLKDLLSWISKKNQTFVKA
jgi:DNA polymerase (family X)